MANALTTTVLFIGLLLVNVEGQVGHSKSRCQCLNGVINQIPFLRIQSANVHNSTNYCPRIEIIVTLKNGNGRRCLNPESLMGKKVVEKWMENQKSV
ncbi:hypothetical protein DPEC_G00119580 [Dallia pectoralis]|uniref:Uncharacterized protein n=1 Tax=Dallia pectoralis TaxID=75939 RepID=A0ACC2GPK9_DALPE|nr:hypothetical protein DPEC_G00119580 [Dallia pectoralis]